MDSNYFGAAVAFVLGVIIATAGYFASRHILKNKPNLYFGFEAVKKIVQIVFLIGLFTVAGYTPWDGMWLLIGGCLGVTLPMIWFTYSLVKINDSLKDKEDGSDG